MAVPRFTNDVTHSFNGDSLRGSFRVQTFDSDGDSSSDGVLVTQVGTNRAASFLKGTEEFEILSIPELSQEQVDLIDYAFSAQPNAGYVSLFPNVSEGNPLLTRSGAEEFRNKLLVAKFSSDLSLENVTDSVVGFVGFAALTVGAFELLVAAELVSAASFDLMMGRLVLGTTGLGGFLIASGQSSGQIKMDEGQKFGMPELVAEGAKQSGTTLADGAYFVGLNVAAGGVCAKIPEIPRAARNLRDAYFAMKSPEVMPMEPAPAFQRAIGGRRVIDILSVGEESLPVLACEPAPVASAEISATDIVPATFRSPWTPASAADTAPGQAPWALRWWPQDPTPPVLPAINAPASIEIGPDGLALQLRSPAPLPRGPLSALTDGKSIAGGEREIPEVILAAVTMKDFTGAVQKTNNIKDADFRSDVLCFIFDNAVAAGEFEDAAMVAGHDERFGNTLLERAVDNFIGYGKFDKAEALAGFAPADKAQGFYKTIAMNLLALARYEDALLHTERKLTGKARDRVLYFTGGRALLFRGQLGVEGGEPPPMTEEYIDIAKRAIDMMSDQTGGWTAETRSRLVRALVDGGRFDAAVTEMRKIDRNRNDEIFAMTARMLGARAAYAGNLELAEQMAGELSGDGRASVLSAVAARQLFVNDFDGYVKTLRIYMGEMDGNDDLHRLGYLAAGAGREGRPKLERLLKKNVDDPTLVRWLKRIIGEIDEWIRQRAM